MKTDQPLPTRDPRKLAELIRAAKTLDEATSLVVKVAVMGWDDHINAQRDGVVMTNALAFKPRVGRSPRQMSSDTLHSV